jgi:hypothetical protein
MTRRRAAVTGETEAIVEGDLVLEIDDEARELVASALADLLLAALARESPESEVAGWLATVIESAS